MPIGISKAGIYACIQNGIKTRFKKGHIQLLNIGSFKKGHKSYKSNLGKHPSEKTRNKMSESRKGKNNPCWKGGITSKNHIIRRSIEFRLWREAVFARDNWTCQGCNRRGVSLNAHHLKSFAEFPELRFAIDNGQTLCEKCHNLTKKGGWKK